jgi:NAD(P)-dependent dehydrogenase (short-subunit alcohol dehydrogenase family)
MRRLSDKVAIVTGAASGIGLGIAQLFIKESAKVVFSDINESGKAAADAVGENALFIQCDISNTESVRNLVAKTLAAFGTIDILINNAGIYRENPISKTSDEEWNTIINTNLKGPFLLTREVLPTFEKNGRGKIVNIASIADTIGLENFSAYSASSGGITAMTRALAIELAPKKINANCICPGVIKTGMTKEIEGKRNSIKTDVDGNSGSSDG